MLNDAAIPSPSKTAGNENTGLIKLIALALMITDHVGAMFFPAIKEMRLLGRIAFPLYCWCIVVGCCHTRNIFKYALRILLVGIVTQPCFMLGLNHKWYQLNVFATLFLGVMAVAGVQKKWHGSHIWGPILAIIASCSVYMDYGWQGVAIILMLYACREKKGAVAAVMTAFCLYWGYGTFRLDQVFGIQIPKRIAFLPEAGNLLAAINQIQFWAILSLPLMLIPMKKKFLLPKWITYSVYPGHLLIIGLIRHWNAVSAWFQSWL